MTDRPRRVFLNDLPYRSTGEDPFSSLGDTLAFSVDDWSASRAMAWVWGIIEGWDSDSMAELAEKFSWDYEATTRLNRLHENFVIAAMKEPTE